MVTSTILLLVLFALPAAVHFIASKNNDGIFLSISYGFVSCFLYFGVFSVVGRYTPIPFSPLVATLGYLLLLVLMAKIFFKPKTQSSQQSKTWNTFALAGLVGAGTFHWLIWNSAMKFGAILPNHDVLFHTSWVGNIARYESLSASMAYSNPLSGSGMASNLYPFSMHALCAYIVEIGQVQPSLVVVSFIKLLVVVFWPLGIFNLARASGMKSYIGPVAAACSTVALYNFPYVSLGWGGVAMITGIVVLTHLVAIAITHISQGTRSLIVVILISLFILLVVHTSEAFLFPLMLLVLGTPVIMKQAEKNKIFSLLLVLCILTFVFPWFDKWIGPGFISGLADVSPAGSGTVYQAVGQIVMISAGMEFHSLWIPTFLLGGIVAITYRPQFRNFLYFYVAMAIGVFVTSQVGYKPWSTISFGFSPWYRQYLRMSSFLVPAVALLAGVVFELVSSKSFGLNRKLGNVLKVSIASTLLIVVMSTSWKKTSNVFEILVSEHSPLSRSDLLAPSKEPLLKELDTPILASLDSGIGYWAADYNMKVFGSAFLGSGLLEARENLLDSVAEVGTSGPTRDLLRQVNVSYVATNNRGMNGIIRPNPTAIELSQNFDVYWKGESVTVWKIRPVLSQWTGNFSTPFSSADHPQINWVLNKDIQLQITNTEASNKEVEISFSVLQNTCQSTKSVTLWNGTEVQLDSQLPSQVFESESPIASNNPGLIKVRVPLSGYQTLTPSIRFNSKYCLFPETGAVIYGAITPVSAKIIK